MAAKDNTDSNWPTRLQTLLQSVPIIQDVKIITSAYAQNEIRDMGSGSRRLHDLHEIDGEVIFQVAGEPHSLLVRCESSGQPRYMRKAVFELGQHIFRSYGLTRGIVVAPYISEAAAAMLAEFNTNWLDMSGNAHIAFPRLYIDVRKTTRDPFSTRRDQRSLFYPQSARVLTTLLTTPGRIWKVTELAHAAGVSAGHVSNMRRALIDREWIANESGIHLIDPDAVINAWRDQGPKEPQILFRGYSPKHGTARDQALMEAFEEAVHSMAGLALASHSVARELAPYARVAGDYFYADTQGLEILERHLHLEPASMGENVTIYRPENDGVWAEAIQLQKGMRGTGPIQTYLDLLTTGERGREAAEFFRERIIRPLWRKD